MNFTGKPNDGQTKSPGKTGASNFFTEAVYFTFAL